MATPRLPSVPGATPREGGEAVVEKENAGVDARKGRKAAAAQSEESELRRLRREQQDLVSELATLQTTPRDSVFVEADIKRQDDNLVALAHRLSSIRRAVTQRENELARLQKALRLSQTEAAGIKQSSLASPRVNNSVDDDVAVRNVVRVLQEKGTCGQLPPPSRTVNASADLSFEELSTQLADFEASILAVNHEKSTLEHITERLIKARHSEDSLYLDLKAKLGSIIKHAREAELDARQLNQMERRTRQRVAEMEGELERLAARRKALLEEQRRRVEKNKELAKYLNKRDEQRHDLLLELQGDLNAAEEEKLKQKARDVDARQSVALMDVAKAQKLERSFEILAQHTGEADIDGVLQRILAQDQGKGSVNKEGEEAAQKLEALQREHLRLIQQLSEIQYSGVDFSHRRLQMDAMEDQLANSEQRAQLAKTVVEYTVDKFPSISMGLDAIYAKLESQRTNARKIKPAKATDSSDAPEAAESGRAVGFSDEAPAAAPDALPSARGEAADAAGTRAPGSSDVGLGVNPDVMVERLDLINARIVGLLEKIDADTEANPAAAAAVASASTHMPTQTMSANNLRVLNRSARPAPSHAHAGRHGSGAVVAGDDDDENVVEEISAKGRVMEGSLIAGEDVLDLLEAGREYDVSGMHAASKARMRQLELAERRRKAREAKEAERLEKLGVSVK